MAHCVLFVYTWFIPGGNQLFPSEQLLTTLLSFTAKAGAFVLAFYELGKHVSNRAQEKALICIQ